MAQTTQSLWDSTLFEDPDGRAALRTTAVPEEVTTALKRTTARISSWQRRGGSRHGAQRFTILNIGGAAHRPIERYLGQALQPAAAPAALAPAVEWVRRQVPGFEPTAVIVNEYPDGKASMLPHRDNVQGFSDARVVALVLGVERSFVVTGPPQAVVAVVPSGEGTALLMDGDSFHARYSHAVPPEEGVTETRVSFTFRAHPPVEAGLPGSAGAIARSAAPRPLRYSREAFAAAREAALARGVARRDERARARAQAEAEARARDGIVLETAAAEEETKAE